MTYRFLKMHGIGNDFVIFDAREETILLTAAQVAAIAERRTGVGCDQVIVMEPARSDDSADIFMRIYNADGSEVSSCGNATRCVAWILMEENGKDSVVIETKAGLLPCDRVEKNRVRANMGAPKLDWKDIPLSEPRDTMHLGLAMGDFADPVAVSMGNPHAVFVVADVASVPVSEVGPKLEHYPLFPQRANISFAQPVNDGKVLLRVWERGSGETLGCGTAACATVVALHRLHLASRKVEVVLPGGSLDVEWDEKTNHVLMTGSVHLVFSGLLYL